MFLSLTYQSWKIKKKNLNSKQHMIIIKRMTCFSKLKFAFKSGNISQVIILCFETNHIVIDIVSVDSQKERPIVPKEKNSI